MSETQKNVTPLRVSDLKPGKPVRFSIRPEPEALGALRDDLGLLGLRKLVFEGQITAAGKADWHLTAHLGATVDQACIVTLEPVTTRLEEDVSRRFLKDWAAYEPEAEESEIPEDVTAEALGEFIDLHSIMTEALAFTLPDYPRSENAALEQTAFAPPGVDPITDEETRPFASLATLKDKLEKDD